MKVENSASPTPRSRTQTATKSGPARVPDSERRKGVKGVKADIGMTINRPAHELYNFWRNFENLPQIMTHIESVECLDSTHSRWRARRTKDDADSQFEWESEVISDRPGEMIAWRTVVGAAVQHAGSIWFRAAPRDLGTEVKLQVTYESSGFADFLAKLTRRSPSQQMREELRHFKQLMESGELPTTVGQPASRTDDVVAKYQEAK